MKDTVHDPNQMTGAEMVVRALKDHGVEHIFGYPGGAVLPIYDEIFQQERRQAHPGAPRAGRRPCRRRLCALDRQARRGAGHLRPGRHQLVTPLTDALMDFDPAGLHHRPGADAPDRQRCLPGMRHRRHHAALHQAQLAGARTSTICRACCMRRSMSRPPAVPARSSSTSRRTCSSPRAPIIRRRKSDVHVSYAPRVKGDPTQIRKAVDADRQRQAPDHLYRRRRHQFRPRSPPKLLRELVELTGFPITSTLMGLGAYPASGKNWLGMLGMHGTYEANMAMHDCDVMICIGARFDDRITGRTQRVLAEFEEDPHRHRSVVDQQEHPRRRADHRRCRQRAGRHAAGVQGRGARSPTSRRGGSRSPSGARAIRSPTSRTTT